MLGTLFAPNLTPTGVLAGASDGALARAIREGVGIDGRPLIVMPSQHFHRLSDPDLAAIIGFLRSQPGVSRTPPSRKLGLTPYVILGLHQYPVSVQPPVAGSISAHAADTTTGYGGYLVDLCTCADCHSPSLEGQHGGLAPSAPNAVAVAQRGEAVFDRALRHGIAADGHPLDPSKMPWPLFARLSDPEMRAIWAYVRSRGN